MAYRSPQQRSRQRRIEALIRVAAPVLDVVLYAGDRASRIVGRNEIGPERPHRPGLPNVTSPEVRACEDGGRNRLSH